jgi:DUF1680 family protein
VELYFATGDRKYIEMAQWTLDAFLHDSGVGFANWAEFVYGESENPYPGQHNAGWAWTLIAMLDLYRATGDPALIEGARKIDAIVTTEHIQPHGAPSGQNEAFAGTGPNLNTELCGTFTWFWFWDRMLTLTGEPRYADLAEKALFNALPGHRAKDGSATSYFMAPNQLVASRAMGKTHLAARLYCECCQSNGPRLMPIMAEHMTLRAPENGLALAYYGASVTRAALDGGTSVTLEQETNYPFEETVRLKLTVAPAPRKFTLRLRVPGWCDAARVKVNGQPLPRAWPGRTWAHVYREWKTGDTLELSLPMQIKANLSAEKGAYVERGPLLYVLPVAAERKPVDRWGSFEEYPASGTAWNRALLLDPQDPASSFAFEPLPVANGGHAWENPPVALTVKARRVAEWTFDPHREAVVGGEAEANVLANVTAGPPMPARPLQTKGETETVRLVPFGFTLLRMTYLPYIEESKP